MMKASVTNGKVALAIYKKMEEVKHGCSPQDTVCMDDLDYEASGTRESMRLALVVSSTPPAIREGRERFSLGAVERRTRSAGCKASGSAASGRLHGLRRRQELLQSTGQEWRHVIWKT